MCPLFAGESERRMPERIIHDWLEPAEQAIMDTATSTAEDYGHIALVDRSGLQKDERKLFSGEVIALGDIVRASTLAPRWTEQYGIAGSALVRIKPHQVGLMAQHYPSGSYHPDPTGEMWGNILIDVATMRAGQRTHLCHPEANAKSILWFGLHGRYGSTLESVEAMRKSRPGFREEGV